MSRITDKQFNISLEVGYLGEDRFKEFVKKNPWMDLRDVSDDPTYRSKDIDFIITNTFDGRTAGVEIKTDTYSTGNFFLEELTHEEYQTPGWLYKSEADILVYYFINGTTEQENVYFLNLHRLRNWIDENKKDTKLLTQKKVFGGYDPSNNKKTVRGWTLAVKNVSQTGAVLMADVWDTFDVKNEWKN